MSILLDGWSDGQRMSLINFIVVTKIGPVLLEAVYGEGEYKEKLPMPTSFERLS